MLSIYRYTNNSYNFIYIMYIRMVWKHESTFSTNFLFWEYRMNENGKNCWSDVWSNSGPEWLQHSLKLTRSHLYIYTYTQTFNLMELENVVVIYRLIEINNNIGMYGLVYYYIVILIVLYDVSRHAIRRERERYVRALKRRIGERWEQKAIYLLYLCIYRASGVDCDTERATHTLLLQH